jgi:superfamily II RNA helicase
MFKDREVIREHLVWSGFKDNYFIWTKHGVDVSYAAPQAHEIVNVALQQEYSPDIVFIFSQGRKYLYHV